MIDWFASKIGMLIFVTVVLALLLGFMAMETGAFQFEQKARMAEDVARLIDASADGTSVTYDVPVEKYALIVDNSTKSVSVDGISRQFLANANYTSIMNSQTLTVYNIGGTAYVKG